MSSSAEKASNKTVILGVIGYDAHVIGNRIIEHALTKEGYKVINLGIFISQEDFINTAIEADADAILVGSLYGHAELDCKGFREKCIESGLDNITLYVGGNLAIGEKEWNMVEETFLNMGFDRAFPPETLPQQIVESLNNDLK